MTVTDVMAAARIAVVAANLAQDAANQAPSHLWTDDLAAN